MRYLLCLFAIYCLIQFTQYLTVFLRLKKFKIQYQTYKLVTVEEIPKYLVRVFLHPLNQLRELGFIEHQYLQIEPMLRRVSFVERGILLVNQERNVCAVVTIKFFSESVDLFQINFYSFLEDRVLLTMNGEKHALIGEMPGLLVQDGYEVGIKQQWQNHQDRVNQLIAEAQQLQQLTVEDAIAKLTVHSRNYVDYLARQNKLLADKQTNHFKLKLNTTIKLTHSLLQGSKQTAKMLAAKRRMAMTNGDLAVDIPPEIEVEAFQRLSEINRDLISKKSRLWILLISLAVSIFALSIAEWFDGLDLMIFIAVLGFHELGHLIAMRWFGYRDTSVMFIPFFGALATGTKADATLTQKFWVSFAGPLPGLLLGIILGINHQSGWIYDTSLMLIILNLFNLLPVYPLDGGQIADLLLFSGFPYVGVCFRILGVALLGLLGIYSPLLLIFAILIAFSLPQSFRNAKANKKMRSRLQNTQKKSQSLILRSIFQNFADTEYDKLPFNKRYYLAKDLLHRQQEAKAKLTTKISLICLYLFTLVNGVVGGIELIIPEGFNSLRSITETPQQTSDRLQQERQAIIDLATQEIAQNPHNVNAYLARANALQVVDETQRLSDYEQIVELEPTNLEYRLTRASLRNTASQYQAAIADYDYILTQDNNRIQAYYGRARAFTGLKDYSKAIVDYSRIIEINDQDISAYYFRADMLVKIAQYNLAIADYNRIVQLDPQDAWAYRSRGEIELKRQNYQKALDDANRAIDLDTGDFYAYTLRSQVRRVLGDEKGAQADEQTAQRLSKNY